MKPYFIYKKNAKLMEGADTMVQAIVFFFTLIICTSCNHSTPKSTQPTFASLESSYDGGWGDDVFSIKIDSTGQLLLSKNRWEPYQYYQGQLSQKDLQMLFLKVKDTGLEKLEPHYKADHIADKHYYNIWVTTPTHKLQKVQAYGDSVPIKLESLRQSVRLIRDTVPLEPTNQNFCSLLEKHFIIYHQ